MTEDLRQPWNGLPAKISIHSSLQAGEIERIAMLGLMNRQSSEFVQFVRSFGTQIAGVRLTATYQSGLPNQGATGNRTLQYFSRDGIEIHDPVAGPEVGYAQSMGTFVAQYVAGQINCLGPVRTPDHTASAQPSPQLDYNARNLGNALFPNLAGYTSQYEELVKALRVVFPSTERPILPVGMQNPNAVEVAFREEKIGIPVRLDRASSGQVEALTILMRLVSSPSGSLVTIEEPEAHFHGDALRRLASIIKFRAKAGTQIIISSHTSKLVCDPELPVNMPVYFLERDPPGPTRVQTLSREKDITIIEEALE